MKYKKNNIKSKTLTYSKIIAGTMTWGSWGKQLNKSEMIKLMHHCISCGISTFDHADIYGGYTNEIDFGSAFLESGINREDIQLISKCGIQYLTEKRANKIKHYNYDKDYIIWSAENTLNNLKTEYLDLFLLHRPSPLMHPDEVSEAITTLKQQGKIKNFGVSNFTPSQIELISKNTEVTVNQIEFSLTQHKAMYDGTLDQLLLKNLTPMSWSPLGSVFKEDTELTKRIKQQLNQFTEKYNASMDQLLLAWIFKHPSGIHPVIGTTNETRIKKAAEAVDINLELEDWFFILESSQGHKVP